MSSRRAVQAPWILAVALLLAAGIARAEPEYDDGGAKSCIDFRLIPF